MYPLTPTFVPTNHYLHSHEPPTPSFPSLLTWLSTRGACHLVSHTLPTKSHDPIKGRLNSALFNLWIWYCKVSVFLYFSGLPKTQTWRSSNFHHFLTSLPLSSFSSLLAGLVSLLVSLMLSSALKASTDRIWPHQTCKMLRRRVFIRISLHLGCLRVKENERLFHFYLFSTVFLILRFCVDSFFSLLR